MSARAPRLAWRGVGLFLRVGLLLWLGLAGVPDGLAAGPAPPPAPETCLTCHGDVDPARLARSRHQGLTCARCHAGAREVPHAAPLAVRCDGCHQKAAAEYRQSVHHERIAAGRADAPACGACHAPAHEILSARDPASPTYHLNLPRTCGRCHGGPGRAPPAGPGNADVYTLYLDSIHGRALARGGLLVAADCVECHGSHDIRRRADPGARVHRTRVASTCGQCHVGVAARYVQGVHGAALERGNPMAPVCNDCHTAHQIRRVETEAWKLDIVRECGTCHAESLATYRDTFHGQVTALGFTRVARCSDCHGAHDILPAGDPRSRVNAANLVATCRACHPEANANFVKYAPHVDPGNRARNPAYYYAARFMTALLVGVFGFFGLHTTLWGIRSLVAKARGRRRRPGPRE